MPKDSIGMSPVCLCSSSLSITLNAVATVFITNMPFYLTNSTFFTKQSDQATTQH